MPARHADSGFRFTTVSTIDIGAQSVAVFARPALPHTDATSGKVMRMESSTWSSRRCVVSERAGSVFGMYMSDPSFSGGMNSLPRTANGRTVSSRMPAAPPSTSQRARSAHCSTGRYSCRAQRLSGFSASARIFPFTNQPMSAGTSVTESSAAAAIAKVLVSASGRNSRPSWSSNVNTGRNDSVMIRRDMKSAGPTSRAASKTRSQCGRSGSCSMCLWRFSSITIAASIMAPIAMAIPPRLMILPLMPSERVTASDTRMPSGSVAIATRALRAWSPADERDDDRLLEQRAPQCLDGPVDQVRAVVRRHDPDAGRQRGRDLGNPLLHAVDHTQRVLAIAHHHDPTHGLPSAIPLGDPEPQVGPDRHPGHITDPHRAPILSDADRDLPDVPDSTEVAEPANRVVRARDFHRARPNVLVGPAYGRDDLARRYAVGEEPGRVEQYLVLAHEPAQTRDLRHARHGLKRVAHLEVLNR